MQTRESADLPDCPLPIPGTGPRHRHDL